MPISQIGWSEKFNLKLPKEQPIIGNVVQHKLNSVPGEFLSFGSALLKKAANERTNQLESVILFKEGYKIDPKIEKIMNISDFPTLRKKASQRVFFEGQLYWIFVPYNDTFLMEIVTILNITAIGNFVKEIEFVTRENFVIDNISYAINGNLKFYSKGSKLEHFILIPNGEDFKKIWVRKYQYKPTKNLPGGLFRSNFQGQPELEHAGLLSTFPILNYLSQEIIESSYRGRDWWILNSAFSDLTQEEFLTKLKSGSATLEEDSFNQKIQGGHFPISTGSPQQTIATLNFAFVETKIKEYLGIHQESTSTGANKHSLEITLQNQFSTETLWSIRDVRENDYKEIFKSAAELCDVDEKIIDNIELKLSPIEQAKIDLLREKIEQVKNSGSRKEKGFTQKDKKDKNE